MKIVREEIDYKKQMENNNKNMKKSEETDTVIAVDPTYADAMEQDKKAEEKVGEIMKKKHEEQKSIETPDPSTGKPLKKNMYTKQEELDESLFDGGEGEEVKEEKNTTKLPGDVFTMVYDFIFDGLHKSPTEIEGLEDIEDVAVGAEKYFQDVQNFTNIGVQIKDDEKNIAEYVKKIADALGFSTSEKRYERGVKNGDYVLFVEIPKDVAVMKASRFLGKNESLKEARSPRFELEIWVPGSGGDDERERPLIETDDIDEVLETIYKTKLDNDEAFLFTDVRRNFQLDQEYSREQLFDDIKDNLGDEYDLSGWDEYFVETNAMYDFEESKKCEDDKCEEKLEQTIDGYTYNGVKIRKSKNSARETIWSCEGEVFPTLKNAKAFIDKKQIGKDKKVDGKELTEDEKTRISPEDIGYSYDSRGFMMYYKGEPIGGAGIGKGARGHSSNVGLFKSYAEATKRKLLSGNGESYMMDAIREIDRKKDSGEEVETVEDSKETVKEDKKLTEDAKIYISLSDYRPWSGAVDTFEKIRKEDKMDELDAFIEEMYPDGLTDTELNDLLWFEPEYVFDSLGIDYDKDEDEEDDDEDELELDFEEEDEEETDEE